MGFMACQRSSDEVTGAPAAAKGCHQRSENGWLRATLFSQNSD